MKSFTCLVVAVFIAYCCPGTQGYGKNQGTGFFPSIFSSSPTYQQQLPVYQSQIQAQQYVYPAPTPMINSVPAYHQSVLPYGAKVQTPHMLYPALPVYPKRGLFSTFAKPSLYNPYHGHQETVTKSVIYSVLLSEILRRI